MKWVILLQLLGVAVVAARKKYTAYNIYWTNNQYVTGQPYPEPQYSGGINYMQQYQHQPNQMNTYANQYQQPQTNYPHYNPNYANTPTRNDPEAFIVPYIMTVYVSPTAKNSPNLRSESRNNYSRDEYIGRQNVGSSHGVSLKPMTNTRKKNLLSMLKQVALTRSHISTTKRRTSTTRRRISFTKGPIPNTKKNVCNTRSNTLTIKNARAPKTVSKLMMLSQVKPKTYYNVPRYNAREKFSYHNVIQKPKQKLPKSKENVKKFNSLQKSIRNKLKRIFHYITDSTTLKPLLYFRNSQKNNAKYSDRKSIHPKLFSETYGEGVYMNREVSNENANIKRSNIKRYTDQNEHGRTVNDYNENYILDYNNNIPSITSARTRRYRNYNRAKETDSDFKKEENLITISNEQKPSTEAYEKSKTTSLNHLQFIQNNDGVFGNNQRIPTHVDSDIKYSLYQSSTFRTLDGGYEATDSHVSQNIQPEVQNTGLKLSSSYITPSNVYNSNAINDKNDIKYNSLQTTTTVGEMINIPRFNNIPDNIQDTYNVQSFDSTNKINPMYRLQPEYYGKSDIIQKPTENNRETFYLQSPTTMLYNYHQMLQENKQNSIIVFNRETQQYTESTTLIYDKVNVPSDFMMKQKDLYEKYIQKFFKYETTTNNILKKQKNIISDFLNPKQAVTSLYSEQISFILNHGTSEPVQERPHLIHRGDEYLSTQAPPNYTNNNKIKGNDQNENNKRYKVTNYWKYITNKELAVMTHLTRNIYETPKNENEKPDSDRVTSDADYNKNYRDDYDKSTQLEPKVHDLDKMTTQHKIVIDDKLNREDDDFFSWEQGEDKLKVPKTKQQVKYDQDYNFY